MPIRRYTCKFVNSQVDPTNYQLIDFTIAAANVDTDDANASHLIGYLCQADVFAAGTDLVEIQVRAAGSAGGTAVPFPVSNYLLIDADAVADGFTTAPRSAYPCNVGTSATVLAPLGTSISVSERSATVGRTGRGRHFLGFINASTVSAGGTLIALYQTAILNAYNEFFLGVKPGGGAATVTPLDPIVSNGLMTSSNPITSVKPQPIFSNLESRRR